MTDPFEYTSSEPDCPIDFNVTTVHVTITSTKTVHSPKPVTSAIDATVTSSLASTYVISLVDGTDQPMPYSFVEDNGTTSWMGGRKPPTASAMAVRTSFVTWFPVRFSDHNTSEKTDATPSTITSYITTTPTLTITAHSYDTSASGGGHPQLSPVGWNASLTTFLKLTIPPAGNNPPISDTGSPARDTLTSEVAVEHVTPTAYGTPLRRLKLRQAEGIVVATIDGVAVSWTNNFFGSTQVDTDTEPTYVPVTATAPSFGGAIPSISSPYLSPVQTSAFTAAVPTTTGATSPSKLSASSSFTTFAAKSADVDSSTYIQPGLHPVPSIPPGFQWTHPAASTRQLMSATKSQHGSTLQTSNFHVLPTDSSVSAAVSSAVATTTSSCGDASPTFVVDFDDLPSFSAGAEDTDVPPIFNPYRKLYWEGNFGYVPPPTDPFPPHSPPQLGIYRGNGLSTSGSSDAGLEMNGELGAGPRAENNAYWIDAFSVYLGCSNGGPDECTITINGYTNGGSTASVTQTVTQPPCPGLQNCSLALIDFDQGFRGLSGLQINAAVDSKSVDYYLDDLQLGWSNNSCSAQELRSSSE